MKVTGKEFNDFYANWPLGLWHEDENVLVNGVETEDLENLPDTAVVDVKMGGRIMTSDDEFIDTFHGYFRKWRKTRDTKTLAITFHHTKEAEVREALKGLGVRISG